VVGSNLSGERGTLHDLRIHKPRDRCKACELDQIRPIAAHAEGEECPAEKAASACIDPSVREGQEAGVRNPPPVDEVKEEEKKNRKVEKEKKKRVREEETKRKEEEKVKKRAENEQKKKEADERREKKKKEAEERREEKKRGKGKKNKKAGVSKGGENVEKRPSRRTTKVAVYMELSEEGDDPQSGSSSESEWSSARIGARSARLHSSRIHSSDSSSSSDSEESNPISLSSSSSAASAAAQASSS
jgi:hypothetical protein